MLIVSVGLQLESLYHIVLGKRLDNGYSTFIEVVAIAKWYLSFNFEKLGSGAKGFRFKSQYGLKKVKIDKFT